MKQQHNKETFVREYCRARRIPYRITGGILCQLYINKKFCCYSIYNLPWEELIPTINKMVEFDEWGYFKNSAN